MPNHARVGMAALPSVCHQKARTADVIDVAVKVGDEIKLDDTLITLETDKATMDVPSTVAGLVKEVKIGVGSKVSEGDVLVLVEAGAVAAAAAPFMAICPNTP